MYLHLVSCIAFRYDLISSPSPLSRVAGAAEQGDDLREPDRGDRARRGGRVPRRGQQEQRRHLPDDLARHG